MKPRSIPVTIGWRLVLILILALLPCTTIAKDTTALNGQLIKPAGRGDLSEVKALLDSGAEVNAADTGGWTALMSGAAKGNQQVIELLLTKGSDVNAKSKEPFQTMRNSASMETVLGPQMKFLKELGESDWTALMSAAAGGHLDAIRALLRGGGDVNAKSRFDWTALKIAKELGHSEIVELLKAHGAKE